ncbi:MAG TPA: pilus assembly protein TadG-related protein [Acidobacteriaceae bacterium]|nr:pilus assembly protein TadG-related protein [Acidobacteriaceae bacterium]
MERRPGDDGRARQGEAGQTTVLMVLFLSTFLFGFVAVGIDVESLFQGRRQAQAAADAAAVAAAEEASYGTASETAAATAIAKLDGFDTSLAVNPATVTVGTPTSGNYSGSSSFLQVVVSKPLPMFFARVVTSHSTVTVSARAVAGAGMSSPSCVCLEGTTGTDLALSNNAQLNATSCGTMVDSSSSNAVTIVGSAKLGGQAIGSISTNWDTAANVNNGGSVASGTKVVEGVATACAPPLPAVPSYSGAACTADPLSHYGNGGSSYSVGPGSTYSTTQTGNLVCYNSLTIGSNGDTVNINPGTYVINGGTLHFESARATGGAGVFFYLTGTASMVIDNGANVTLSAPTSGTYSGDLVFQDPADTQALSIQGGSNTNVSGTIYAPSSNVTFGNGSGNLFDDLVAKTLTMNGGALASSASANFGSLNISTAKLGE